ncbi:MotA/TolQ/ExbB proton channel family protein [Marivibrio halodurans]|uniref:MotA/TolQ/ExbB proton channel family protein n=1 Tax=Marivibrio halodurans TaxID=2039722 RepID=A0A8J7S5M9_9PROT|nr:MotA/TolQ/ExbB proton channel family protein [Marivibrio halodurans]MBP5857214.1 MotA/TolQ/ExbB proton channel family protein [Marivibrio halodurans]
MSMNSLLGFLIAIALFIGAIVFSTDNYLIFLSFESLLIVVGGTLAATFLGQEARYVLLALRGALSIFKPYRMGRNILNQEVGRIIKWGYLAQQKGVVALDQEAKKVEGDEFLAFAVEQLLSGYSGDEIRENLSLVAETTFERNMVPAGILRNMGGTAPAFGMIGTLVGLIIMLDDMGSDPTQLGKGLAVALNTTLYGVIIARMMFIPAANKLTQRNQILRFRHELITEGIAMLADRKNPRYIQDRMNSFLDPAIRFDIDRQIKK